MKVNYDNLLQLAKEVSPHFPRFYLADGTAIMFCHRHRMSYDLDFFSYKSFSFRRLAARLRKIFPLESETHIVDNIDFIIRGIKVSFVYFPFKNILPVVEFEGIKLASDYDLFLNKIYVAGRRIDPKDPVDAAFLYQKYQWDKLRVKKDFEKKFPDQSFEIFLGALLSTEDYPQVDQKTFDILKELA